MKHVSCKSISVVFSIIFPLFITCQFNSAFSDNLCRFVSMDMNPQKMILNEGESGKLLVTVTGEEYGCTTEGFVVEAHISDIDGNYISVTPSSAVTNINGQAIFTITGIQAGGAPYIEFYIIAERNPNLTYAVSVIPKDGSKGKGMIFGYLETYDADDMSNKYPIEDVIVTIDGCSLSKQTRTSKFGYYEFTELYPGHYKVTYEREGYYDILMTLRLENETPMRIRTLTMDPIPKSMISGYVLDTQGNPINGARLRLVGIEKLISQYTVSDSNGFFSFSDVDSGTYAIIAGKRGYKISKQTVTLEDGEQKEMEITLEKRR